MAIMNNNPSQLNRIEHKLDKLQSDIDYLKSLLETEEKKEKVDWKAKAEMGVIKYLQRKSRKPKIK